MIYWLHRILTFTMGHHIVITRARQESEIGVCLETLVDPSSHCALGRSPGTYHSSFAGLVRNKRRERALLCEAFASCFTSLGRPRLFAYIVPNRAGLKSVRVHGSRRRMRDSIR